MYIIMYIKSRRGDGVAFFIQLHGKLYLAHPSESKLGYYIDKALDDPDHLPSEYFTSWAEYRAAWSIVRELLRLQPAPTPIDKTRSREEMGSVIGLRLFNER